MDVHTNHPPARVAGLRADRRDLGLAHHQIYPAGTGLIGPEGWMRALQTFSWLAWVPLMLNRGHGICRLCGLTEGFFLARTRAHVFNIYRFPVFSIRKTAP